MGVLYPLVVTNKRLGISKASADSQLAPGRARIDFRELATWLFKGRTIILTYIGSALQLFVAGSLMTWLPSFMNRYYGMATGRAGVAAAVFVLIGGIGMVVCGALRSEEHTSELQSL